MAKIKFKFKKNWKNILAVGLTVVLGIGAIFGITRLVENDDGLKKISPAYTVGGLGTDGKYEETEESIYTKTAFECQGLKITPDFDSTISYQVFFYDQNEQYIESTANMTEFYSGAPELAMYARIEITPAEDEKVSWYEVNKYAKQLTVEVNKKQEFKYYLTELNFSSAKQDKVWVVSETSTVELQDAESGQVAFDAFKLNPEYGNLHLVVNSSISSGTMSFVFVDEDGIVVTENTLGLDWVQPSVNGIRHFDIVVPENSVSCYVVSVSTVASFGLYYFK